MDSGPKQTTISSPTGELKTRLPTHDLPLPGNELEPPTALNIDNEALESEVSERSLRMTMEGSVESNKAETTQNATLTKALSSSLAFKPVLKGIVKAAELLGLGEKPPRAGLRRMRWTCVCGSNLYDDFLEQAPRTLDELQDFLNKNETGDVIRQAAGGTSAENMRSAEVLAGSASQSNQQMRVHPDSIDMDRANDNDDACSQGLRQRPTRSDREPTAMSHQAWILPIFQYDRYGTMVKHLRVDLTTSDKDLFLNIKERYQEATSRTRRFFAMRGVKKISCVKFIHATVEPDIHKFDDWPGQKHSPPWIYKGCPAKRTHIPLVGHTYLMHLWQNPSHCDRNTYNSQRPIISTRWIRWLVIRKAIPNSSPDDFNDASRCDTELADMSLTSRNNRAVNRRDSLGPRSSYVLLRIPKKLGEQLTASDEDPPEAWGLYFEEGFGVHHFLLIVLLVYAAASIGFAIYWCEMYGGPNTGSGAFAVASWMVSFMSLVITVWFKWAD
ncbi:MAG: hypothetical protein Q9170_003367 [Blastenia crenularia]